VGGQSNHNPCNPSPTILWFHGALSCSGLRRGLTSLYPASTTQSLSQIYTEMAQKSRLTAGNRVARSFGWMRLLLCVVTTSLSKDSSAWSTILILGITIKALSNRSAQHLNCVPSHMHHMLTQHVFRDLDQDEQPYSYFR